MKKILSMILCVALVLSLGVAAFAAESTEVAELGDNTCVVETAYTGVFHDFTAEVAGTYIITNTNESGSGAFVYVYDAYGEYFGVNNGEGYEVEMAAGETIQIEAYVNKDNVTVTFNIALSEGGSGEGDDPVEDEKVVNDTPQLGENYMLVGTDNDDGVEVTFTPDETATYIFTATDGYFVFDSWGYEGTFELTAGEGFTFTICSDYDSNGYCEFTIEKQVIEGDTNEEPQLGANNIPSDGSWDVVYFTPAESGLYKFTNDHVGGMYDTPYFYLYSSSQGYPSESYVYAGMSSYVELAAGEEYKFELKGTPSVMFTIEKINPETVEPDGSKTFPYPLVEGDNTKELTADSYFTYTPTVDGLLTLTGVLTNAEISADGMLHIDEETWVMNVTANEKIMFEVEVAYGATSGEISVEMTMTEGHQAIGTEEFPLTLTTGTLERFVNNDYENIWYTYTPDADGVLTIAGELGNAYVRINGITMVPDSDGNIVKQLRGGEQVTVDFYVSYSEEEPEYLNLEVSFEAKELEADGTEDFPYELTIGTHEQPFYGSSKYKTYYTYTATADGYLYLNTNLTESDLNNLYINGMNLDEATGIASKYLYEGDTLVLYMYSYGTYTMNYEVTFEEGELVPDGTSDAPFVIPVGQWNILMADEDTAYDGYYYMFRATADGVLNVEWLEDFGSIYISSAKVNGESINTVGDGAFAVEMKAGDVFTVYIWDYDPIDLTTTVTFTTEGGNEGGNDGPVVDPDDGPGTGDYTFLVFALMVMSMTAVVVLVSKKRNF